MTRTATALLILTLTAAACSVNTEPDPDADVAGAAGALAGGAVELTVRHGEEERVHGSLLRVRFVRVAEDSRCPIDAVCVWMGNAAVEVALAVGTGPGEPLLLNSSLEPRSATAHGVRVTLLELSPAPRASEPARPEEHAVRLRLERAVP